MNLIQKLVIQHNYQQVKKSKRNQKKINLNIDLNTQIL